MIVQGVENAGAQGTGRTVRWKETGKDSVRKKTTNVECHIQSKENCFPHPRPEKKAEAHRRQAEGAEFTEALPRGRRGVSSPRGSADLAGRHVPRWQSGLC